jgi:hypothetical protein
MSFQPDPLQVLFLWRLLASDGEAWWKEVKPQPPKAKRDELERADLIDVERRRSPKGGTGFQISLTDKAWAWAADNLDAEVSRRSTAAGPVLQDLLTKLKGYLEKTGVPLVEVLGPTKPPPDFESRLRSVCLAISGGRTNTRVRLADIRAALSDVPRGDLDKAVLAMGDRGVLALYPIENPRELTYRDREAAIMVGGEASHLVYLEA